MVDREITLKTELEQVQAQIASLQNALDDKPDYGLGEGDPAITRRELDRALLEQLKEREQRRNNLSQGGDFYASLGARVDPQFASAVISTALEGQTLMGDALDLLSLKKTNTFYEEARRLGVSS